ncbi:glycoside hydrolase family 127 protein [bacterium]|nr:glycoside hydrolase family 127 protein [bacterium]
MKQTLYVLQAALLAVLLFTVCSTTPSGDYPIQPVPFTQVHIDDAFWAPRIETNRAVTIPHAFHKCEENGRLDNFAAAGGLLDSEYQGIYPFDDTDVYKTLEGASYALMVKPDPALDAYLDSVITLIAAAQEDDGYLYTVRTLNARRLKGWFGDERWARLSGSHELYNAGHLFEAAAAHYQATGKRSLLNVALKFADLIDDTFGPGKLEKPPGHQVIEMGLVKLYRVTGDERYLNLAKFFLDARGRSVNGRELGGEYNQDHKPVVEQDEAVGHAVRAGYMYAGMADVAAMTGDRSYIDAIDRLWENVAGKKLYLTGGIGATGSNEGFAGNYDLPNMSAYNETCASIGNIYWNHRLFLLHGDARYIDVMERTLYNALLSGISLDGTHFFYPNPLESVGQHQRAEWFGCACCPGNVTRFMASVPGYVYALRDNDLYVNLYASNTATLDLKDQQVVISQKTDYPWEGTVDLALNPGKDGKPFTLCLRIPGWARGRPLDTDLYSYVNSDPADIALFVNGQPRRLQIRDGYARIRRGWKAGDTVRLELPMEIRRVTAIDSVEADRDRVALERGPIVFCAEFPDNPGGRVRNLLLTDGEIASEFVPGLLNGVTVLRGTAEAYHRDAAGALSSVSQDLTMIPYYGWSHRGRGEMAVWLAAGESAVTPAGTATLASESTVTASFGKNPEAVNDLLEPSSSGDHNVPFFHWWPHKGTREWIQYDFPRVEEVSTVEVYWFDDTGRGECRLPASWRVMYMENGQWKPVWSPDPYPVEMDSFNKIVFETVRTGSLRLSVTSREGWAGGIHEWKVR